MKQSRWSVSSFCRAYASNRCVTDVSLKRDTYERSYALYNRCSSDELDFREKMFAVDSSEVVKTEVLGKKKPAPDAVTQDFCFKFCSTPYDKEALWDAEDLYYGMKCRQYL